MLRYGQLTSWFSKMKNKNKFHGWIFFKILLLFIMAGGFVFLAWDAKIRRGLEPGAEIEDSRLLEMKNRFENAQEQEAFPRMIPESKKREMLDCGYARLDAYFPPEPSSGIGAARTGEAGRSACELSADNGLDFEYDRLEVVIIADGKIKGRGGSGRGDILKDIELAVDLAVKDKEFGGALTSQGKDQAELLYSFSYNRRELKDMGRQWLEAEIEPGLHTLGINKQGKETFLEALTFARKNYSARQGLKELCRRVESSEDCRENKQTAFYLYDEFAFKGGRQGKTGDLFRYNILVEDKDIDSDFLLKRLESARNWYLETVNRETGRLEYLYFPDKDSYSAGNNQVRQLAVLWSMAELDKFLEKEKGGDYASRPEFKKLIANTFDHYLKFAKEDQEKYYLEIQGQAKLAYNAFLVMALLNSPDYPGARGYMNKLAQGIVKQQKKDGSFATHFNSSENSGVDFYPGEAMLALMKAYQETGNKLYLDSVKKAFPYYRDYWRDNKETAFIPWHSQADYLLFLKTRDQEAADFVMEMNDWLLRTRAAGKDFFPDEKGGISPDNPGNTTYVRLEGLNDAYRLALVTGNKERAVKYYEAIRKGTRFILQSQFTFDNAFYFENPGKATGGFKSSPVDNELRIDYTQHAISALMKAYRNQIF